MEKVPIDDQQKAHTDQQKAREDWQKTRSVRHSDEFITVEENGLVVRGEDVESIVSKKRGIPFILSSDIVLTVEQFIKVVKNGLIIDYETGMYPRTIQFPSAADLIEKVPGLAIGDILEFTVANLSSGDHCIKSGSSGFCITLLPVARAGSAVKIVIIIGCRTRGDELYYMHTFEE